MHAYLQSKLNEEQFQATVHTSTSTLILAGAGSGKTRVLTYKIANLVLGHSIPPTRILAVTFTNKAANEMKERLSKITEEIRDTSSHLPDKGGVGGGFDQRPLRFPWIGTFHSIFLKLLKEDIESLDTGYTKNFIIYDTSETSSIIKKIIKENQLEGVFEAKEAKSLISKAKNEGQDVSFYTRQAGDAYQEGLAKVYKLYQKALVQANALDFDDLLLLPYLLFVKKPDILRKRQQTRDYILVDEAQDTNWIQFELLRYLSGSHAAGQGVAIPCSNITFIGDDYQSIYGRRGALMENFLNLKKYWPDLIVFKLQINYRSRPHIVSAGNHIIKFNNKQYDKTIVPHRKGDDHIVVFSHNDDMMEAINIVDFIIKLRETKQKKRSDFAFLYRTNAQSSTFERVLVQKAIPYRIYGAFKFFERAEVKDIVAYLKVLSNPKDDLALQRIINVPSRKLGDTTIKKLLAYGNEHNISLYETLNTAPLATLDISKATVTTLTNFLLLVQSRRDLLAGMTPAGIIARIVRDIHYKDYLIKEEGEDVGEEKFENIGQLINMAEKYQMRMDNDEGIMNNEGGTVNNEQVSLPPNLLVSGLPLLETFLQEVTLMTDAAEADAATVDAVKLMTVHASKGLEFSYVFICGLEEGLFPLNNQSLDPKTLEEERRLMYVAITRAQDHLFLSHAQSRMQRGRTSNNAPSRFLSELPQELLKSYDLGGSFAKAPAGPELDVGDRVKHTLFGEGEVIEVWNNVCVVRFVNPKYGIRKMEPRYLKIA